MTPVIVIAAYRPKPGKEAELRALMATHLPTLRAQDLVTDRAPILMTAQDGTILEVFEWRSQAAIDAAHREPAVLAMWERFGEVCEYAPLVTVPEASKLFAQFAPLALHPNGR